MISLHTAYLVKYYASIFNFMKGYRHHEAKGYQYSSRQMALSYISNVVARKSKPQEQFKFAHTSGRKSRQQMKKAT
jgi:hypothetical protein